MDRCVRCFCCPRCSTKLIAVSVDQSDQQVEWKCFGCDWKSGSISLTAEDVNALIGVILFFAFTVVKTSQSIDKENTQKDTVMNMAAECVRFELGIKEITSLNPYSILVQEESKPLRDVHNRRQEILDKQKAVEVSLRQPMELLPNRACLLSKMTIKCSECSKKGAFGLLCKPQVQPLLGDSSLYM